MFDVENGFLLCRSLMFSPCASSSLNLLHFLLMSFPLLSFPALPQLLAHFSLTIFLFVADKTRPFHPAFSSSEQRSRWSTSTMRSTMTS